MTKAIADQDVPCPHPADARARDPYAAGCTMCLACGASWENAR